MTRAGRFGPALVVVGATAAIVVGSGQARAADEGIVFSRDGVHWSASLGRPVFDPDLRWVPGDTRTERFFVRNQGEGLGDVDIDVLPARRDALIDTGSLKVAARVGDGPWTTVADGGLQQLLDSDDVRLGGVVPVEMRVRLPHAAPVDTMVLDSDVALRVTVADARADGVVRGRRVSAGGQGAGSSSGGTADGSVGPDADGATGLLPDTGAATGPVPLILGAVLLLLGAAVLASRRRTPLSH